MTVGSLGIALSGLRAAQEQVSVISNNIASAGTEGYTRKTLPQSNFIIDGESFGVQTLAITRSVNTSLQADLYSQTSLSAASNAQLTYFDQIQAFHADPLEERSVANLMQSLNNDFIALADNPTNPQTLNATVAHATTFAGRINNLSSLYTQLRNDVQAEMQDSVSTINNLLQAIVDANSKVVAGINTGKTTAEAEDIRDKAVLELSQQIDISYYRASDGTLVVQNYNGSQVLADYTARTLLFSPSTLGVNNLYPTTAQGVYIDNPSTVETTEDVDLTTKDLGGRLGGLIELRDEILPRYQSELDEMAQKLAVRFDDQGLRLFTDPSGSVPPSVAPPANTGYSGFSTSMQVNEEIADNPDLLRLGTEGETIPLGSSRIIDRIVDYTFGKISGERAVGDVDLDATGVATIFASLGIAPTATVTGTKNIQALSSLTIDGTIVPTTSDTFSIQIGAGLPINITVAAGNTATDLVTTINTAFTPDIASLSATGRLVLQSSSDITIATGTMLDDGLEVLGLTAGTTTAQNPSFTVQLGDGLTTAIPIIATDTSTQLLSKLNAVAGLNASLNTSGFLSLSTDFGVSIKLVDGTGSPVEALGMVVTGITHDGFRTTNLGPDANITSRVLGADTLVSYGQRLIANQANEAAQANDNFEVVDTYRATIETQSLNDSAVNLDVEMSSLLAMQRIYSANARVVTTSIEILDELMDALR